VNARVTALPKRLKWYVRVNVSVSVAERHPANTLVVGLLACLQNRGDRGWTQAVEQRNTGQSSCCVHASMPVLPSFCEACPASTQPVPYREGSKASLQVGQAGPLRGVVPPLG